MNQGTANIKSGLRLSALAMMAMALAGCSTYYQSYYPDSGVYYGDSAQYGHGGVHSRAGYGYQRVNPAVYPYWSLDYFYFSQYYHPYSVYVGFNEPLYYPYPGWVFGDYRAVHPLGYASFGFGYPWYGYGSRYPAYSFGFFSGYSPYYYSGYYRGDRHGHHRIRQIDRRLEALQYGDSRASRRELLGRDRVGSSVYDSRRGYHNRDRNDATRSQSRAAMMRQRNTGASRAPQRTVAPDRRVERRRAPDVRSERRPDRRALDRDRIRRDGGGSAYQGHRGIPIENLRGRVIVDSRSNRSDDARGRDAGRRDHGGAAKNIRRAPAIDWNRGDRQSRQQSGRVLRRADNAGRDNLLNRSTRRFGAPPQRPNRRAAPSPRPARDVSRPEAPKRASSSSRSRQSEMRQDSSGRRSSNRSLRNGGGNSRAGGKRR